MLNTDDVHAICNVAADMFEAMPQRVFTREEVVGFMRSLPAEVCAILLEQELARVYTLQCREGQVKPS